MLAYKRSALLSVLFVMLNVALGRVSLLLYRNLVDDGLRASHAHIALGTARAIAATVGLTALAQMLDEFFSRRFGLVVMNDVRNRLYQHLVQLPMGFYLTTDPGAIINRFTTTCSTSSASWRARSRACSPTC